MKEIFFDGVKKCLLEGEEVLWSGKPDNSELSFEDCGFVLSRMCFGIVLLYLEIYKVIPSIIRVMKENGFISSGFVIFFFLLLLLIFFVIYSIVNIVIVKKTIRKKTTYVVTDKRILVFIGGNYEEIIKKYITEITNVYISSIKESGIGTITFGENAFNPPYIRDGKREQAKRTSHIGDIPIFNDIDDAKQVYELVNSLRNKN